jgi:hypothetical protein
VDWFVGNLTRCQIPSAVRDAATAGACLRTQREITLLIAAQPARNPASASRSWLVNTGSAMAATADVDADVVAIGHLRIGLGPVRLGHPRPSDGDSAHHQSALMITQGHHHLLTVAPPCRLRARWFIRVGIANAARIVRYGAPVLKGAAVRGAARRIGRRTDASACFAPGSACCGATVAAWARSG